MDAAGHQHRHDVQLGGLDDQVGDNAASRIHPFAVIFALDAGSSGIVAVLEKIGFLVSGVTGDVLGRLHFWEAAMLVAGLIEQEVTLKRVAAGSGVDAGEALEDDYLKGVTDQIAESVTGYRGVERR